MNLEELTDFDDWTSVRLSLEPWSMAYDERQTLRLVRSERSVHVYEPAGAWRARHRRQLHRLGFRARRPPGGGMAWEWAVPDDDVRSEINTHNGKMGVRLAHA